MGQNRWDADQPRVARRAMLHGASLGGALALLGGGAAMAAETGPFPDHPRWKFVFVNHVTTNPFFVPTQYGIQDACALLGQSTCHALHADAPAAFLKRFAFRHTPVENCGGGRHCVPLARWEQAWSDLGGS